MSEIEIGMSASEGVVLTVLTDLKNGKIHDAIACFAKEFTFKDHGIGLEFKDEERLAEFFHKRRELYPDSLLLTDTIFVSGNEVITEWTLQATLTEPFFGGLSRKVPVTVHGASIVRTDHGKIADWADYYDGLTSRRTALASYFTDGSNTERWCVPQGPRKHKHSLSRNRKKARDVAARSGSYDAVTRSVADQVPKWFFAMPC